MPIINLTIEEHQSLTRFLSHPKAIKYRSDLYDTDTFDSMEDKVFDASNTLSSIESKVSVSYKSLLYLIALGWDKNLVSD